jgi:hypothetical protein
VDGTYSGLCPTTAYGIHGVNSFGSATGVDYYGVSYENRLWGRWHCFSVVTCGELRYFCVCCFKAPPNSVGEEWSTGGMILIEENRSTRKITCPSGTSSIRIPTRTNLETKPSLSGERPATNRLSRGTAPTLGC